MAFWRFDITDKITRRIYYKYEGPPSMMQGRVFPGIPPYDIVITDISSEELQENNSDLKDDLYPNFSDSLEAILDAILRSDLTKLNAIDAIVAQYRAKYPSTPSLTTGPGNSGIFGAFELKK